MNSERFNITIPSKTAKKLRSWIKTRSRSSFITQAIEKSLKELEKEKLSSLLKEGYISGNENDIEINNDFRNSISDGLDD